MWVFGLMLTPGAGAFSHTQIAAAAACWLVPFAELCEAIVGEVTRLYNRVLVQTSVVPSQDRRLDWSIGWA